MRVQSAVLFLLFAAISAQAQVPIETFIVQGAPTSDQLAQWSALPGTRDYVIQLSSTEDDLSGLTQLQGARKITVEFPDFPAEDDIAAWQLLANQGVEFVAASAFMPAQVDIDRLNRVGFTQCNIRLSFYPDPADAQRTTQLGCNPSFEFVGNYPKYAEKDGVAALPARSPLTFHVDFWPYYTHMDVLNLIPQPIHLWIQGMYPPADELQYLHNLRRLNQVTVETDFDPISPDDWKIFGNINVTWRSKNRVPSAAGLEAFQKGGANREFVLETDRDPSEQEMEVLRQSPLAIRWIHAAP